jgi:ATP diphosphatase
MVDGSWEEIKAQERSAGDDGSVLAGVARALPALKRSQKLGKRAARAGFDWPDRVGVHDKIGEELREVEEAALAGDIKAAEDELGDLLFAVVNLARHLKVDAEKALSAANNKFERRFRAIESELAAAGHDINDLSLDALEERWQAAKRRVG